MIKINKPIIQALEIGTLRNVGDYVADTDDEEVYLKYEDQYIDFLKEELEGEGYTVEVITNLTSDSFIIREPDPATARKAVDNLPGFWDFLPRVCEHEDTFLDITGGEYFSHQLGTATDDIEQHIHCKICLSEVEKEYEEEEVIDREPLPF